MQSIQNAAARMAFDQVCDGDKRLVVHWRFDSLVRAGYAERDAVVAATHFEVDLHQAVDLVQRGCPSATALRILL
jgi:hypothetical protein